MNIHYDTPRSPTCKQWTDKTLLSTRNVDDYLAESDAYQRASYERIMRKWKQYDQNEATRLITSFDSHYNMKRRFLHDGELNRSSEKKYGTGATYYRYIGSENNPKKDKPCDRHKRRTEDYEKRQLLESLKLPSKIRGRNEQYFLPKLNKNSSFEATLKNLPTPRLSVSGADNASNHTY